MAFHINQRQETIDLRGISGALMAARSEQMQTFVADLSGREKAGEPVLCLNDQGGSRMDISVDVSGTLRARMDGHQPAVLEKGALFENHGIDARCSGPHKVSPTLSARSGTGGNNLPLVVRCEERPTVFARQGSRQFQGSDTVSTQCAGQHEDAADLAASPAGREGEEACPRLVRRLTPLECERLQGFPDGWTDLPGASDSARYKALGNSVAIPCVEYVLGGIALCMGGGGRTER